jgi:hypothetical protein
MLIYGLPVQSSIVNVIIDEETIFRVLSSWRLFFGLLAVQAVF